jgi:hypothetical protein
MDGAGVLGRNASLILRLDSRENFLLRFHAYPYRPTGFLCQRSDVTVNNKPAARIYLEQDWNNYESLLPKELLVKGENRVEFHFPYSSRQDWHGINPDRKSLSVAFDVLQLISAEPHDKDAPN